MIQAKVQSALALGRVETHTHARMESLPIGMRVLKPLSVVSDDRIRHNGNKKFALKGDLAGQVSSVFSMYQIVHEFG